MQDITGSLSWTPLRARCGGSTDVISVTRCSLDWIRSALTHHRVEVITVLKQPDQISHYVARPYRGINERVVKYSYRL